MTTTTASSQAFISTTVPDTEVGTQLSWFLAAVADAPLSQQEIGAHFDAGFLSKVSVDEFNQVLLEDVPAPSGASLVGVVSQDPTSLVAVATFGPLTEKVSISVDGAGLIGGLLLSASLPASPTSWAQLDRQLRDLAPQVGFLAAEVSPDGSCTPIHEVASSTARPMASEFKLFVLGALAHQITSGRVTWGQKLTVQDALRSAGNAASSGSLQFSPSGTKVSVKETAIKMISISDNTAADMLIDLVGRSQVESQVRQWSSNAARDLPFLTTREMLLLHDADYPTLADQYLSTPPNRRAAFLASSVDPLPLSRVQGSTEPRDVDSIEWFASPDDVCTAFAGLQQLSTRAELAPLATVLSVNDGDLGLDDAQWPTVWFKGGSEPGVLTLGYLAKSRKGQTFVVSAMVENPATALSPAATEKLLAIVKGAFGLVG